jgi:hypothetical protein
VRIKSGQQGLDLFPELRVVSTERVQNARSRIAVDFDRF